LDLEVINTIFCLHCMVKVAYGCSCSDFFHSFNRRLCENVKITTLITLNIKLKFFKISFFWFMKTDRQLGRKHPYTIAVMETATNSEARVEFSYKFTSFKNFFNYLVTQWISAFIFTNLWGSTNICSILKLLLTTVFYVKQQESLLQSIWVLQC
jgi:hypothetical protein